LVNGNHQHLTKFVARCTIITKQQCFSP